jgi:putative ABC transport system permease protein
VAGVREAVPFYLSDGTWRNDQNDEPDVREQRRMVLVMGFRLADHVFRSVDPFDAREVDARRDDLRQPDTLLIDRQSRPEFLPIDPGRTVDIGAQRATIVGQYTLGSGFSADSSMMVSAENFGRIFGPGRLDRVNIGLVRLEPGADLQTVAAGLRKVLPDDEVQVLTRDGIQTHDMRY